MGRIIVDHEESRRIQEAIDRPKSREFVLSLAEPLLEKVKAAFPDQILEVFETDSEGYGDIAYRLKVKDKWQEISDFLAGEELMLGIEHGVTILFFINEDSEQDEREVERERGRIIEESRRIQGAIDRPKSREFVLSLAEPLIEKVKAAFPDQILEVFETDSEGYGDIAYRIKVKDKWQEISDFLADEELILGIEHGVRIITLISEDSE